MPTQLTSGSKNLLPSSRELGALFQDALYERTGLQAVYSGNALNGIAALDRQTWIPFEGGFCGAWRLRWDSSLAPELAATALPGTRVNELMAEILEASLRRWSVRQQSLGPLIMGSAQAGPPNGLGPDPGAVSSAALNVDGRLMELCLYDCKR